MKNVELKISNFKDIKKVILANYPLFFICGFLIFIAFVNGMNGEFVSDDIAGIVENARVHSIKNVFATKPFSIQLILYALVYKTFGLQEIPFHIMSMIGHLINVILFFVLIYNLYNKKVAALATVLFSVHPIVAESVLWISALNYLINTFIVFTVILIYLIYKKTDNKKYLLGAFSYFLLAVLVFPNFWLFLIPFMIVGIEFLILDTKLSKKAILVLVPLFLIAIAGFVMMSQTRLMERIGSLKTPDATPFLNRLPFTIYMPWHLFVYPDELTIYHEGQIIGNVKYVIMVLVSIATIVGTLIMLRKEKYKKYAGTLAIAFIATLPVFSPIQVAWFVAERYLYISVGFFCVFLAMLLLGAEKKYKKKNLAIIVVAILSVAYIGRDIARTQDWKTRKTLWESTAAIGPYSPRVHNNLGDVYGLEGNWEKAIYHFELAIKLKPNFYYAMHNLANTYMKMGQLDNAEPYLLKSLELQPNLYQSIHKLALIEYNRGNIEKAKELLNKTLEYDPNYLPAIEALQILQQRNL